MFNNLGIQWAATLIGCLAAVLIPIPVIFYIYGGRIRAKSEFAPTKRDDDEEGGGSAADRGKKAEGENAV